MSVFVLTTGRRPYAVGHSDREGDPRPSPIEPESPEPCDRSNKPRRSRRTPHVAAGSPALDVTLFIGWGARSSVVLARRWRLTVVIVDHRSGLVSAVASLIRSRAPRIGLDLDGTCSPNRLPDHQQARLVARPASAVEPAARQADLRRQRQRSVVSTFVVSLISGVGWWSVPQAVERPSVLPRSCPTSGAAALAARMRVPARCDRQRVATPAPLVALRPSASLPLLAFRRRSGRPGARRSRPLQGAVPAPRRASPPAGGASSFSRRRRRGRPRHIVPDSGRRCPARSRIGKKGGGRRRP